LAEDNDTTERAARWLVGVAGARPSYGVYCMLPSAERITAHFAASSDRWLFVLRMPGRLHKTNCADVTNHHAESSRPLQTVNCFHCRYFAI